MRRALVMGMVAVVAFLGLGSPFGYEQRCEALAFEIVQQWFENSPILPPDIERIERFEVLGCSDGFLEVERQRIIATNSAR